MKRMLVNATQREEMRVALVDGNILYDLEIESAGLQQTKSNIYKGKIVKLAPSLDAAFVDYGEERHGFLPFKEIHPSSLVGAELASGLSTAQLKNFLKEGQEILVQVSKGARGTKGAALTTYLSLAGSYLVLMPNNPRANGISRRIDGAERQQLKTCLSQLSLPKGMGLIVRTAGIDKGIEELRWDLSSLLNYWEAIQGVLADHAAPCLIHQEGSILPCAIRDHLHPDIQEIWVDEPKTYEMARQWIRLFKPDFIEKVYLYSGETPLFNQYQIESQIERAFHREVPLPSGGGIVIDTTEALTAIDVNSARSTRGASIEETAYSTNMEAAEEVARQLRLRDLGGLVVIDFIDMHRSEHQQALEERLKACVRQDRARVQVGGISQFGLLELSRQRLRPSLEEFSARPCPRCQGKGSVRDPKSLALAILRILEDLALRGEAQALCAMVPTLIGTYLLNEKRLALERIESTYGCTVVVVPDPALLTPEYRVHALQEGFAEWGNSYTIGERLKQLELQSGQDSLQNKISFPALNSASPIPTGKTAPQAALLSGIRCLAANEPEGGQEGKSKQRHVLSRIWDWICSSSSESRPQTQRASTPLLESRPGEAQMEVSGASRPVYAPNASLKSPRTAAPCRQGSGCKTEESAPVREVKGPGPQRRQLVKPVRRVELDPLAPPRDDQDGSGATESRLRPGKSDRSVQVAQKKAKARTGGGARDPGSGAPATLNSEKPARRKGSGEGLASPILVPGVRGEEAEASPTPTESKSVEPAVSSPPPHAQVEVKPPKGRGIRKRPPREPAVADKLHEPSDVNAKGLERGSSTPSQAQTKVTPRAQSLQDVSPPKSDRVVISAEESEGDLTTSTGQALAAFGIPVRKICSAPTAAFSEGLAQENASKTGSKETFKLVYAHSSGQTGPAPLSERGSKIRSAEVAPGSYVAPSGYGSA